MACFTRLAAPVLLLGIYSGLAQAQDAAGSSEQQLQGVTVTGTRIKSSDAGQTPVVTITRLDIEKSGLTSVADVLAQLSSTGSNLNLRYNNSGNEGVPTDGGGLGAGASEVNLRNLGTKRTLVLVDGIRFVDETSGSGVSSAVDLNGIPLGAVERIEVLPDGASSLYGSDAISGVVNIITKKSQKGGNVTAYGSYDAGVGSGSNFSADISYGAHTQGDRWFVDLSYYKQNSVSSASLPNSSVPVPGTGLSNASSATLLGRFIFSPSQSYGGLCPDNSCDITLNGPVSGIPTVSDFTQWQSPQDRFNFAPYNELVTPNQRVSLFAQNTYEVTDNISWYLKGVYTNRNSNNAAAPTPLFIGGAGATPIAQAVVVDATNPYNPFGETVVPDEIARRMAEGGPRVFDQAVDTFYFSSGFQGQFALMARQFDWDVNGVWSKNRADQTDYGDYDVSKIKQALGPLSNCSAPCVPLNIFGGVGSITPDMLNYIAYTGIDHSEQTLTGITGNISGDIVKLPAGMLKLAVGYEYRKQTGEFMPNPVLEAGNSADLAVEGFSGGYSVNETYAELQIPLLADMPGVHKLDMDLATRYSSYSEVAGTTSNRAGIRWQPVPDVTVRGTLSQGFRAPSIGELDGAGAVANPTVIDPCSADQNPSSQTLANCAALGVPPGYVEQGTQINAETFGSSKLSPEKSRNQSYGIVYSPAWFAKMPSAGALDLNVDYYRIAVLNAIQAPNAQSLVDRCVATADPASSACAGISRDSLGDITSVLDQLRNLGTLETEGLDFGFDWHGKHTPFGTPSISMQDTYVFKYHAKDEAGQSEPYGVGIEDGSDYIAIPRLRMLTDLGWKYASLTADWRIRYISGLNESCGGAQGFAVCTDNVADTHRMGAVVYHDLHLSWEAPVPKMPTTVAVGANNLFGRAPPVCLSCVLNGYDPGTYDLEAHMIYASVSTKF